MARYTYRRNERPKKNKGTGFAILCICMVALGAASWYALGGVATPPDTGGVNSNVTSAPQYFLENTSSEPTPPESSEPTEPSTTPAEDDPETPEELPAGTEATFFVMPVAGNMLKPYSAEEPIYSETYLDFRVHKGVDIAAKLDTPVMAAGHGVVKAVRYDDELGNIVEIDHGNGIVGLYCGLSDNIMVKKGQAVEAAQPIGNIGTVPGECLDAPHLHIEVQKDGKTISPLEILGIK